jgi:OOP family OmpA-OmpF porin
MKNKLHRLSLVALGMAAVLALPACGTSSVSRGITDSGTAAEVVFPSPEKDAWLKEGTFPNLDNLRAVGAGATKDQLYDLLGRPHFREGLAGPREWDYIFHFRRADGSVATCQYKVIFDKNLEARSFHWSPAGCGDVLKPAVAPVPVQAPVAAVAPAVLSIAPPAAVPAAAVPRRMTLDGDSLFRFDKSAAADMLPEGRRQVEALAAGIQKNFRSVREIRITGHTDRLGSDSYNDMLSRARANTVREMLVRDGIPAQVIRTQGMGKRQPVVTCVGTQKNEALIRCLQPNRRVDIQVDGAQ